MQAASPSAAALRRCVLDRYVLRIHGESYESSRAPRSHAALASIALEQK